MTEQLEFADEYLVPILDGEKTATVRVGKELPAVGDRLQAVTQSGREFATLEVRRTAACLAVEAVELIDVFGAQYGSETADELLEGLNNYYDGVKTSSTVQLIVFEVVR